MKKVYSINSRSSCLLAFLCAGICGHVNLTFASGPVLKVPDSLWASLSENERNNLQGRFVIETLQSSKIGVITDVQGIDKSTSATTGGERLGAAVGNAIYTDNAFKGDSINYSAKNQLGAMLLGALVGSALDKGPESKFHFRYTIKTLNGDFVYADQVTNQGFRRSVGECVSIPDVTSVTQSLCEVSLAKFRETYLSPAHRTQTLTTIQPRNGSQEIEVSRGKESSRNEVVGAMPLPQSQSLAAEDKLNRSAEMVLCKFGSAPPVSIDAKDCELAEGKVLR